jgi:hypothetical protein
MIGRDRKGMRTVGQHPMPATALRDEAGRPHQPRHPFGADRHAAGAQRVLQSGAPVGLAAVRVQHAQLPRQLRIALLTA